MAGYLFFANEFERADATTKEICKVLQAPTPGRPDEAADLGAARQQVEARVITLVAGPLAQGASEGRDTLTRTTDYRAALDIALSVSSGDSREATAYLDWLLIRAKRLTSRPDFQTATQALATALVERSPIHWSEAKPVIDEARARVDLERMGDHPLLQGE